MSLFKMSNELHTLLHGTPSHDALYNISCTLSLASAQGTPIRGICSDRERCLDGGVSYLRMALVAGYPQLEHAKTDPDLEPLRQHRREQFWSVFGALQHLQTMAQAPAF